MNEELLQQFEEQSIEDQKPQVATIEDVQRLVSAIPRGPKGDDAQITAELVQEILDVATPIKGVDYRDGIDGTNGIDGKDAPVLSAEDIAGMLEALPEVKKLSFSAIKGLNKLDDQVAVLEAARKRNSADHEFYDEKINEILEWIDRIKGLKLIQAGSNRISATNINWATVNWGDFFTDFYANIDWTAFFSNVDWTQNNWADFFTAVDWSQFTNWNDFLTSLITNWSATNWDDFIDNFITNVDNDDVFNFLNQMSGLNKGDMLVYNSVTATWEILAVGADGTVITANSALDQGVEYAANASTPIAVQEEGANVETALTTLNFTGAGATATQTSPGVVQVDIPGGGGGSANAVVETVTQTAHGFAVGDWVRVSAPNTYVLAQANSSANAEVVGVISTVTGPNEFDLVTEGVVSGGWVPSYGAGNAAHLSTSVAGATQATAPTTVGTIDKPVGIIIEDGVKMYVHNYRGRQITNATSGAIVTVPQQFFGGQNPTTEFQSLHGDGTDMYYITASSGSVERLTKDPNTGIYMETGDSIGFGGGAVLIALGVDDTYVYIMTELAGVTTVYQCPHDLSSSTAMTFAVAPGFDFQGIFVNTATQLGLIEQLSLTSYRIDYYDISGATLTFNSSVPFTSSQDLFIATAQKINGELYVSEAESPRRGEIGRYDLATGAEIAMDDHRNIYNFSAGNTGAGIHSTNGFTYTEGSNVFEILVPYQLARRSGATTVDLSWNLAVNTYTVL